MKKLIIALLVTLVFIIPAFSSVNEDSSTSTYNYLHVVDSQDEQFFLFNEKGVYLSESDEPIQLREGYIIISGHDPITIKGPFTTIVLQQESLLTVGRTIANNPSYYLLGGSASFLIEKPFSGNFEVSTPVSIYNITGPGEIFVTSDTTELIFNLGAVAKATNAITRETSDLKPFYYLNMADPFKNQKELSLQSYQSLSISRDKSAYPNLPSVSATDELTFKIPPSLYEEELVVAKESVVVEEPKEVVIEPIVEKEKEIFNFYIIHTSDISGELNNEGIGFEKLSTLYRWAKEYLDYSLIVDAGNALSGSDLVNTLEGEPIVSLIDAVGYDAITPAPMDYVYGLNYLKNINDLASEYSELAILGANVVDENNNSIFDAYRIYDFNSFKIALVGASFAHDFDLTDSLIEQAQNLIDQLATQSDAIVLLGNFSFADSLKSESIAKALNNIDLIIDGSNADVGAAGKVINNTLIVKSLPKLGSVGIIEAVVEDNQIIALYPIQISAREVNDPTTSTLAAAYGIYNIPSDLEVASYIEEQKQKYIALTTVVEPEIIEEEIVLEAKEVEQEVVVAKEKEDDAITIKQPLGIISEQDEFVETVSTDWGVSTTFNLTRDTLKSGQKALVGFSVNPFINHKNFALGLQAYFLTDGSLFSPSTYTLSSKIDTSSTLNLINTSLRFIDFIRYGEKDNNFYLLMDGETPINFGNRIIVNSLNVASNPYEKNLGFYLNTKMGIIGLEAFFDNLYLDQWVKNQSQIGALRFAINPKGVFEFGISSIIEADLKNDQLLYPALDFIWRIKNERKLGVELFGALATRIDLANFALSDLFDKDETGLFEMFPNFLATGGLDIRTLNWNLRFVLAAQNRSKANNLLSLGSLNSTNYSNTDLIDTGDGIYYIFGTEASYSNKKFGFDGSYYLPVNKSFNEFVTVKDNSDITADSFNLQFGYRGSSFDASLGFRKIGLISSTKTLLSSSGSQILTNLKDFFFASKENQPYLSLAYKKGIYKLAAEVSIVENESTNIYVPRVNLAATVTLGKKALSDALDPKEKQAVIGKTTAKEGKLEFNASVESSYNRLFFTSDSNSYLSLKPTIELSKANKFSIKVGPRFTVELENLDFVTGTKEDFSFGTDHTKTSEIIFDVASDLFNLIDEVTIGKDGDAFRLNYGSNQTISFGPLVRNLRSLDSSDILEAKSLSSTVVTEYVNATIFVNDLSKLQLGGLRVGVAPFKKYKLELGLSALGNFEIKDSSRIFIIPALDLNLPFANSAKSKIGLQTTIGAAFGYDGKFEQLMYGSNGNAFQRIENYIVGAKLYFEFAKFNLDFDAALSNGALSYGMFDSFYSRNQNKVIKDTIDDAFAHATNDMNYTVATTFGYNSTKFDFNANYTLDIDKNFNILLDDGTLNLDTKIKLNWFDLTFSYSRNAFVGAIKNIFSASNSLMGRVKDFVLNDDTSFAAEIAVRQGPITFSTKLSTYVASTLEANTYNSYNYGDTSIALTLGAKINLF